MTQELSRKYRMDLVEGRDYRMRPNHSLPQKIGAEIVVIGRNVYCAGELSELPRHEYLHVAQFRKYGRLLVLLHYGFFFPLNILRFWNGKRAFREIPFEREAREFEAQQRGERVI